MVRYKRLDRVQKTINIDSDLNKELNDNYPGKGSDLINEALRTRLSKEKTEKDGLVGFETSAGRLAYQQSMEKLSLPIQTDWNLLNDSDKVKFMMFYNKRLIDLQSRGF